MTPFTHTLEVLSAKQNNTKTDIARELNKIRVSFDLQKYKISEVNKLRPHHATILILLYDAIDRIITGKQK